MTDKDKIISNLNKIKENIRKACENASRNSFDIKIIAATKYANPEQIQILIDYGITDLGENKADDLVFKSSIVKGNPIWHFIGHLQSNKIKKVVPIVQYIHSIDDLSTLNKINNLATSIKKIQKILIEVNISNEETKYGIKLNETIDFITNALKYDNIKICGLMTMAPLTDDFNYIRNIFSTLRNELNKLNNHFKNLNLTELSMGMSNDYQVAVEEGATMLRIGSAIFI
ncbi:MAG: YggS family pyridoxal phosphate-dependent enzyme [Actinobacteria bacterium]|nr:YggS family pyridoxal phosphate-dependent enzyme [Actinomycetota bacterium]